MYKIITKILLISFLLVGYLQPSYAAIKCWENDRKQRECSYTVPKKFLGRKIEILNSKGQVIKTIPADKTPEQKIQDAKLAKIAAEKKRIKDDKRRRDRILINTFVSVEDILLSRDTKITAIDSIIKISKSNRKKQQKILDKHTQRAANFERKNQKVPETILADVKKSKEKLKVFDDFIELRKQEKLKLHLKYDSDIKRFKELKAIRPR